MKIAAWETFVVGNPPPHEGGNYFIFVKVVTDDGIVGYGECYVATFGPDGRYGNRTDGTSHAAIYLAQGPEGLRILDQYTGADGIVRKQGRILRWEGGNPSSQSVDEGKNYRVIR